MEENKKKKKIKECRIKSDTCFKWHCLGKIFELSLEDIGLIYLISQLRDDETNVRYSLIEEEVLDMFKDIENDWIKAHTEKMKTDKYYRSGFAEVNGQRKATTKHYKAEVERRKAYNKKVDEENGEIEETVIVEEATQTTETPIETTTETEEIKEKIDCEFNIATGEIRFFNESLSIIKDSNHQEDEIASFLYNNQEKFNSYKKGNYISIENIEDVLIEIDKAKDMQLPF